MTAAVYDVGCRLPSAGHVVTALAGDASSVSVEIVVVAGCSRLPSPAPGGLGDPFEAERHPALAKAMAMRESAAWCQHVDRVRLAHYERWSQGARR
jgi:hypothetical protein